MSKDQLPPESQSDSDLVEDILEQMEDVNSNALFKTLHSAPHLIILP
jgi:hypothetical protein